MKKEKHIYLDNAAATPIEPAVLFRMLTYLKYNYGNPSSLYYEGRLAKQAIEEARDKISKIIGVENEEIIFTSGGTESDNLAILGIARAYKNKGKHIIVSSIEHKAVLESCKKLELEGLEVTYLDVDKKGIISIEHFKSSIRPDTILVSIMYANNEIGTIQPLKKIAKIIKESKISKPFFHTDACQAVSYLPTKVKSLGVDALTISSSKIYGPKGVGCLYLNKKIMIEPIIFGGGQEKGIRSGTENITGIVGFAEAVVISEKKRLSENKRLTLLRDYFLAKVRDKISGIIINGDIKNRLPNNINISIAGVEGESLVLLLDKNGVACSTGSACSSLDITPSYVLNKIDISPELSHCSVRFTLGRYTRKVDIDFAVDILDKCVKRIRGMSVIKI